MSKMTREQRLAAGWEPRWIVRSALSGSYPNGSPANARWARDLAAAIKFAERADAYGWIVEFAKSGGPNVAYLDIRRCWSRKRPAAPSLKPGDEVTLRCRVLATAIDVVHVEEAHEPNGSLWVDRGSVTR